MTVMLILAAVLIVVPFLAMVALVIAVALSAFGIFHEVSDARAVAAEKTDDSVVVEPVVSPRSIAA
jgi:Na+/H+ antiporter NhaB